MRKEVPLIRYLKEEKKCPVVVNGLRRGEGGKRADLLAVSRDPRTGGYGMSPIFDWSDEKVYDYIRENDLYVHPLHNMGYPSIGCYPCTTPVAPGEHPRAGRWRHLRPAAGAGAESGPQYCGINYTDGAGI